MYGPRTWLTDQAHEMDDGRPRCLLRSRQCWPAGPRRVAPRTAPRWHVSPRYVRTFGHACARGARPEPLIGAFRGAGSWRPLLGARRSRNDGLRRFELPGPSRARVRRSRRGTPVAMRGVQVPRGVRMIGADAKVAIADVRTSAGGRLMIGGMPPQLKKRFAALRSERDPGVVAGPDTAVEFQSASEGRDPRRVGS